MGTAGWGLASTALGGSSKDSGVMSRTALRRFAAALCFF